MRFLKYNYSLLKNKAQKNTLKNSLLKIHIKKIICLYFLRFLEEKTKKIARFNINCIKYNICWRFGSEISRWYLHLAGLSPVTASSFISTSISLQLYKYLENFTLRKYRAVEWAWGRHLVSFGGPTRDNQKKFIGNFFYSHPWFLETLRVKAELARKFLRGFK